MVDRVPLYACRLEDMVRPVARARVRCWGCRHVGYLDTLDLLARHGRHEMLKAIVGDHEVPCAQCGGRVTTISIEWAE